MNIFILDEDPVISAQMQCDKHIVKMPLETAQMLCSVFHRHGQGDKVPYKEAHKNHPCTLWAGDSADNFSWLVQHGMELCFEYTRRYNKIHKCQQVIMDIRETDWGTLQYKPMERTPHPQCMPDEYKEQDGFFSPEVASVRAYRKYYVNDKKDIAKWEKSRPMPDWYAEWMTIQNKKMEDEKVDLDAYDG
jgi:hypothetical protein